MMGNSTILIVENIDLVFDALVLYVLKLSPRSNIVRVNNVSNLLSSVEERKCISLIILDIDVPGLSALPSLSKFLKQISRVPVALIGTVFGETDIERAAKSGVLACIPKSTPSPGIIGGLGLALSRHPYFPTMMAHTSPADYAANNSGRLAGADEKPQRGSGPTPRQIEILKLLADGRTNAEIAAELSIAESTVRLHLRAAYRRLGVRNRIQATRETLRLFPNA